METIVAISSPRGSGAVALIRLSGSGAIDIASRAWRGRDLHDVASHTAHLGSIIDSAGETIDQCVATIFRAPNSFTGEDTVELGVHGSPWIQREVVRRLIDLGAKPAGPGDFTRRAFLNGKLDLAQAEGVADLIAASSRAAQRLAISQLSGRFSSRLNMLREQLVNLASLLELELDFSEEDVTFADRTQLIDIANETLAIIDRLVGSYASGKAFKEGVPVAIAGHPNAGKSTLLNHLLDDDKAIVSDIPGTTRDLIEDTREIEGILFRLIDTAGLRDTTDRVEKIGIDRANGAISRAAIVLWLIDASESPEIVVQRLVETAERIARLDCHNIILLNKIDLATTPLPTTGEIRNSQGEAAEMIEISAKTGKNCEVIEHYLAQMAQKEHNPDAELIVTNARHYEALRSGAESLRRAKEGIETGLSADFIAQDIRETLHHLGELTGAITTDTLLQTIFTRFCIGK